MKRMLAWQGYSPKIVIPKMVNKKLHQSNFHKGSEINFKPIIKPDWNPDYKSKSGSEYHYTEEGLYRTSDHWGDFESIAWFLNGKSHQGSIKTGFVEWENIRLF